MVAAFDSPALRKQSASHTAEHLRRRWDKFARIWHAARRFRAPRYFQSGRLDGGQGCSAVAAAVLFRSAVCQSGRTGSLQDGGGGSGEEVCVCVSVYVCKEKWNQPVYVTVQKEEEAGLLHPHLTHTHQAASTLQIFTQRCCSAAARVKKVGLYTWTNSWKRNYTNIWWL